MKKYIYFYDRKGYVLILSVGILAIMFMITTSFALNIMLNHRAALNYKESVKAELAAEAGLSLAIASMREAALTNFNASPLTSWSYVSSTQPSFDANDGIASNSVSGSFALTGVVSDRATYSLQVVDTQSQININDTSSNLGVVLESLVSVIGSPLQTGDGNVIVTNRPSGGYATKEEMRLTVSGMTQAKYNALSPYITANSYIDQNSENSWYSDNIYWPKAPVNINTASAIVLRAVLESITNQAKAQALADAIIAARPLTSWGQFNNFIDTVSTIPSLSAADKTNIKDNANPNRKKPSPHTTDFCFHPSGTYEITSTGIAGKDLNADGDLTDIEDQVKGQKRVLAIVKIYDILNQSTKEQFRGEDANYSGVLDSGEDKNGNGVLDQPTFQRVTWLDTCPVVSTDDQGLSYASNYSTIAGSLKIGFWDNFDEDNDNTNRRGYSWSNFSQESASWPMNISDADGDGDNEIWGSGWPKFTLFNTSKWRFSNNFSIRISLRPTPLGDGQLDTGHLEFHWGGGVRAKLWTQHWGFLYLGGRVNITLPPPYWRPTVAVDPDSSPREGKDWFDSKILLELWDPPQNERTYNIGYLYGLTELVPDH